MAETQSPVDIVKNAVKTLKDQRDALVKQLADVDAQLTDIANAVGAAPPKKPGRKPGRKAGSGAGRSTAPATAPDEDKKKLLEAMKSKGGPMRSGDAFKRAGLKPPQGKKAMAALRQEKKVKVGGPWVSVA